VSEVLIYYHLRDDGDVDTVVYEVRRKKRVLLGRRRCSRPMFNLLRKLTNVVRASDDGVKVTYHEVKEAKSRHET